MGPGRGGGGGGVEEGREENPNPGRFEKREQTIHEIPGP